MDENLLDKDPYWGVLAMGDEETDYQIGGDLKLPKPRFSFWDKQIEYHQPDVSPVSCTVHGALGALSDLFGKEASLQERKDLWAIAGERGATSNGWITKKAVQLLAEKSLELFGESVKYFIVDFLGNAFDVADMGYSVVCSFRGNTAYGKDKADGILDATSFGTLTYGHCVRMVRTDVVDEYDLVVDNYSKGKLNRYRVSREKMKTLVANGVFWSNGYVFAVEKEYDDLNSGKTQITPAWAVNSVEKAHKKLPGRAWHDLQVDTDPQLIEAVLKDLSLLTTLEGKISLPRLAVALDRAGLLN